MRTNSEIVDLIKTICEEKEMSLSELARRVGMAKSAISRYFSKQRQFPLNKISIFAEVLNVTPEYLLGLDIPNIDDIDFNNKEIIAKTYPRIDKIELLANYFKITKSDLVEEHNPKQDTTEITNIYTQLKPPRQQVVLDTATAQLKEQKAEESKALSIKEETTKYKAKKKKRLYTIDVVEKLAAGYGHYLADTPQEYTAIIDINPNTLPSYNYASLVSGDSMLPDYEEGDVVLISQGYDFQNGYVYALIYEDESYLKKVYIENDYIILKSLNPNYKDIKIKTGENLDIGLRIIGRVIHSFKPLNVKNKY